MSVLKIVSRYAKSLFDLADQHGTLDQVHEDVLYAWEVSKQDDFAAFLKSPIIPIDKKEAVINTVFAERNESLRNTLNVMIEHKREVYTGDFCRAFHLLYNKHNHVSTVQLTTAVPMSQHIVDQILETFKEKGLLEPTVELEQKVDPDIIGGFILESDGQVYNASLGRHLEDMKKQFSENLYTKNI